MATAVHFHTGAVVCREDDVFPKGFRRLRAALVLVLLAVMMTTPAAWAEGRKRKTEIRPVYPELARRMNLYGAVKVEVIVASTGVVKNTKVLGGHPVLAQSAVDAVKRWRFEPGEETTEVIEFKFNP